LSDSAPLPDAKYMFSKYCLLKSGFQIVELSRARSGCGIWLCSGPSNRAAAGDRRRRVLVRVARVTLVAELGQHDEDLVGLLAAELDVLVDVSPRPVAVADLDDRARPALLRRGPARQDLRQRDLTTVAPLVLHRVGQLVRGDAASTPAIAPGL